MKIIGMAASSFKGDNGKEINGFNIYLAWPLTNGQGEGATRVYVTDQKLATWAYFPEVGDTVEVTYNRYGKVAGMTKVG